MRLHEVSYAGRQLCEGALTSATFHVVWATRSRAREASNDSRPPYEDGALHLPVTAGTGRTVHAVVPAPQLDRVRWQAAASTSASAPRRFGAVDGSCSLPSGDQGSVPSRENAIAFRQADMTFAMEAASLFQQAAAPSKIIV